MTNSCSKTGNLVRDAYFVYSYIIWDVVKSFADEGLFAVSCLFGHLYISSLHTDAECSLADAECKICKYKSLIISEYFSNYGGQILCRGTEEGRIIYKHLQMKLPSKIKYTNICKVVFPVLCIFTFVNTDFCTFLYSL